jgi:hypothetical protein
VLVLAFGLVWIGRSMEIGVVVSMVGVVVDG